MKKIFVIGTGVVLLGVIAMIVLAVLNLGSIVKTATEEFGPRITKTAVKLDSADISVLSGSGSLNGFLLGNPEGFSMPSALECDTIRVKVNTDSLTTDRIIIEEIFVNGPIVSYEKRGKTDNFKTILANIQKTVAGEKKATPAEGQADQTGAQKTIQINNFIVKNGKINLAGSLLDAFGDGGVGIGLPDIHLKDIGKEKKTSPAEAFALILGEMTGGVTGTVTEVGKQLMQGATDAVKGVTDAASGAVSGAAKGAAEGAESIGGAVKGLFGD